MTPQQLKKFWNLGIARGADGSKHLDVQVYGVIGGGWFDDAGVDAAELIGEMQKHLDAKTVGVRINSIGGAVFDGIAIYNALQSHPGEVTSYVEGLAASAASLIAMAGKTVMGRGSMMMIHPPAGMTMGDADAHRKTAVVLDKIQGAITGIYAAKTGKSTDELKTMVDAETWMTAEDAVASKFADSIGDAPASAESDDPEKDPEEGDDTSPTMTAAGVQWRGALFPVAALPQQIVAMAKTTAPPAATPPVMVASAPAPATLTLSVAPPAPEPPVEASATLATTTDPATPALALVLVPPVAVAATSSALTRAELEQRAPELLVALLAEGAAGERKRLQDIDELDVKGCAELVTAAKYGEKPTDAGALALAVVRAGQVAGAELLAARRAESKVLAEVKQPPPQAQHSQELQIASQIAAYANSRRGGVR